MAQGRPSRPTRAERSLRHQSESTEPVTTGLRTRAQVNAIQHAGLHSRGCLLAESTGLRPHGQSPAAGVHVRTVRSAPAGGAEDKAEGGRAPGVAGWPGTKVRPLEARALPSRGGSMLHSHLKHSCQERDPLDTHIVTSLIRYKAETVTKSRMIKAPPPTSSRGSDERRCSTAACRSTERCLIQSRGTGQVQGRRQSAH